ncbi:MAG: DUF4982 domain-containing protein [Bacteroidales bacterium]|nr:DUF4982 domain-containing protein [Bacteroidales bacterium]
MRGPLRLLALCLLLVSACGTPASRTTGDFNFDWRFRLGDDPARSEPGFDDSDWRSLHLPHDWSIEGEFSPANPATVNGGALPGGIGWYRKHFPTPEAERVAIEFDGIYMDSRIWVNGHAAGGRPYGYSSFSIDITPYLNPAGQDNTIAVRVDNSIQPSGRWYTGCGIYRNVRMVRTGAVRAAYNGIRITTPEIGDREASVLVRTDVDAPAGEEFSVSHRILDASGRKVGQGPDGEAIRIADPRRWDITDPYLYSVETVVRSGGKVVDRVRTRFGFRQTAWDADQGFLLNGRVVKLHGVCLHHDLGCIGSAVHYRALQRQLEILTAAGVNAIRTAHNPPAPELLELCDEMGLLVMDEAFDEWRSGKTRGGYGRFFDEWHERDLTDLVRRDRNHPSVILWSIANEIAEQGGRTAEANEENRALSRHMADLIRAQDDTRAITCGGHQLSRDNNLYNSGALDVIGLNYRPAGYDSLRAWFPGVPIVASEAVSAQNSRGIYYQPSTGIRIAGWSPWAGVPKPSDEELAGQVPNQCTAYDNCRSVWSVTDTHQNAWIPVRDRDFVAGTFVWTGFDYLGEPTAFGWPSRSSYFGFVDLAGFPKDPFYMYQSEWTDGTMLHLLPHWNWTAGEKIDVWAYYNHADEVELFLNGRSLGRSAKTADRLHAFWPEVPFEPGRLEAVSYRNGEEVMRTVRETAGVASALRLTADRNKISADGYDLSYITVEAVDADGRAVPTADTMLHFRVKGKGELFGIDNGNAADTLCLKGTQKALFNGKALAVIRSLPGQKGRTTLTVSSDLGESDITINVQ